MKKRTLVSMILIGILVFAAGMGTFAWFTAEATLRQEINTGTLELNGGAETFKIVNKIDNMKPNDEIELKSFDVENTGSLPMKNVEIEFEIRGDRELLDVLEIHHCAMNFSWEPNNPLKIAGIPLGKFIDEDGDYMPKIKGILADKRVLEPGEKFTFKGGTLIFDKLAGNEYQGMNIEVDMKVTGDQLDPVND